MTVIMDAKHRKYGTYIRATWYKEEYFLPFSFLFLNRSSGQFNNNQGNKKSGKEMSPKHRK